MTVLVIGIGETCRQDDGVGRVVAREVRARRCPGVCVVELSGEPAALLDAWQRADAAIVVDAMRSGAPAGTVARFDASTTTLPVTTFGSVSSHGLGLAHAVELARTLGKLPGRLIVYGVEGAAFGYGEGLTPAVARVAIEAADRAACEAHELLAGEAAPGE